MLFFGHLRTSLNSNEFTTVLAAIGILGAAHIFSWLVVFQYRKNLIDEQRMLARMVASAPPPPDGIVLKYSHYWSCSPPAAEYAQALICCFDSILSRAGLGHLGKGWSVRGTTTRRWLDLLG